MNMFIDVPRLKTRIAEKGLSMMEVAKLLEINRSTLYRRLENGGSGLLVKDARRLSDILELTLEEREHIFFASKVA